MTYAFSITMSLKIITVKLQWYISWWAGTQEGKWRSLPMIKNVQLCYLVREMPFPFILIACPICLWTHRQKCFMLWLVWSFYVLLGQPQIWLIWQRELTFCSYGWKSKVVNCVRITPLLEMIFGKLFKVFNKFADTANEFIKLFSLWLIYIFVCACIFVCKDLRIYVYFKWVIYVCMYSCL